MGGLDTAQRAVPAQGLRPSHVPSPKKKSRWSQSKPDNQGTLSETDDTSKRTTRWGAPRASDAKVSFSLHGKSGALRKRPLVSGVNAAGMGNHPMSGSTKKPTNKTAGKNPSWPPSLVGYVAMSLSAAPHLKQATEAVLRRKINSAVENDRLHVIDWKNEPPAYLQAKDEYMKKKRQKGNLHISFDSSSGERSSRKKRSKRRSSDFQIGDLAPDEDLKRNDRTRRFQGVPPTSSSGLTTQELGQFGMLPSYGRGKRGPPVSRKGFDAGTDWSQLKIVGTCERIDKKFLRLTTAIDPSTIRSEGVLHRSLAWVQQRWAEKTNYKDINTQFKSIRQDLTVQSINNGFSVKVYETHARIALEVGDLSEFNQCQTQLMILYETLAEHRAHFFEFLCYRLLYFLITNQQSALHSMMAGMTSQQRASPLVQFSLSMRRLKDECNYQRFFKTYKANAPLHAAYLTSKLVPVMRYKALRRVAKAYKPTKMPLTWLAKTLDFDSTLDAKSWALLRGACIRNGQLITEHCDIHKPRSTEVDEVENNKEQDNAHGVTHGTFMHT